MADHKEKKRKKTAVDAPFLGFFYCRLECCLVEQLRQRIIFESIQHLWSWYSLGTEALLNLPIPTDKRRVQTDLPRKEDKERTKFPGSYNLQRNNRSLFQHIPTITRLWPTVIHSHSEGVIPFPRRLFIFAAKALFLIGMPPCSGFVITFCISWLQFQKNCTQFAREYCSRSQASAWAFVLKNIAPRYVIFRRFQFCFSS